MQDQKTDREQRRKLIRQKKRRKMVAMAIAALIVVLLIVLIVVLVRFLTRKKPIDTIQIGPTKIEDVTDIKHVPLVYDYAQPVPKSASVSEDYLNHVLFVGDARLGGFGLYGMMPGATVISSGSASVRNALELTYTDGESPVSMKEALERFEYRAVYLVFGITELGWNDSDAFIAEYGALIDAVREKQPGAAIYIHLIVPVSANKSGNPSYLSNERIAGFNVKIQALAVEKKVFFLDASSALCENGALVSNLTSDGLHFNKDGMAAWYEFIKTHYVSKEIYIN